MALQPFHCQFRIGAGTVELGIGQHFAALARSHQGLAGGLGSLTGSVLGTLIVQLLPEFFRSLSEYRMLFYGIAVVLVILLRPNGLFGYREFSLKGTIAWFRRKFGGGKEARS
jgi:ribose/xylose/arabinose/galactoside ABC-type transport system permease subunit